MLRLILVATALPALSLLALVLSGCPEDDVAPTYLSREELMNPETCKECHETHYEQWSGSMHAHAADDPVFLAMNRKAVEEADVGDFCVKCHAPLAVSEGYTTNGLNMDEVPQHLKGVTCYFCHTTEGVEGTHNNPLVMAGDITMRGGISDPVVNEAHPSAYSALHDRTSLESAKLCGSCHDIVNPGGQHIERTYLEWQNSLYSKDDPAQQLTCGQCHMTGSDGVAATVSGVSLRRIHDHSMPGVDVALIDWPHRDVQRQMVQSELDNTVRAQLCVFENAGGVAVWVTLENIAAGHKFPSGAAPDRRAWVEVVAYEGDTEVWSSGKVGDNQAAAYVKRDDPQMFALWDVIYDELGDETHDFWAAAGYESNLLPAPTARSPVDPAYVDTHALRQYALPTALPTRVTMRVRIRPMGFDILDELVEEGYLAQEIRDAMPTFTLAPTVMEWTQDLGESCIPKVF